MKAIKQFFFLATIAALLVACSSDNGSFSDAIPPIISLAGDDPQIIAVGEPYVELGATANDNHDGDLTASIVVDASAVDSQTPGQYEVTYNVSDSAGNAAATVTRTVIYEDRTPPQITLLGDNPQTIIQGDPYVELGSTATDNVDGDLTSAIVIDHSTVDTNTLGSYDVTYDVQDSSGNSAATTVRAVNVEEPPVARLWYRDSDQDGYSDGNRWAAYERPRDDFFEETELIAMSGDCNDKDAAINPGAIDVDSDGIDQDCNGLEFTGHEEVVYDWTTDRCGDWDIPNFPARAFVDSSGQVQLFFSYNGPRRLLGPDLNNLTPDCELVMISHRDNNPAMFNDEEWIGATYTEDGETIYAIIHNAWHACPDLECWYNGLTLAVSTDSGLSYQHPVAPPLHVVAASSLPYPPGAGPHGIFYPTSIVKGKDGYYYAMAMRVRNPQPDVGEQWTCLIRTSDLADPDAWRFWNGSAFDGVFLNPYADVVVDPSEHDCPAIDFDDIQGMTGSLTYNEYLERYVLIGVSWDSLTGKHGFYISYSDDLIEWSHRKLVVEKELLWTVQDPNAPFFASPSLLDPESGSRNFETGGKTAYLYYMRNNRGSGGLDHDLLRIPIEFLEP